ncbi:threonine aldolase family protein [Aestuariivirga sp.]|jgi:threonine aldolase|uniref:threonine aldolase family protein n=1 Tax=Aestuariivirga sp. TaxID=2650926 RepID=UPI003783A64C
MNFASDNVYGVHPRILAALSEANTGTAPSYGGDDFTRRAEEKLKAIFGCELRAFLVTSGTAANGLALSAITPGFGAIICHAEAHINVDECNSPELFTGGAKLIGLHGAAGKITPALIEKTLKGFIRGEHDPKPKGVSLTNATELGTVYSPAEVKAISEVIRPRGMKLHMDGARFANAVAGLGCSPAELTWKAGVDALSFGATKNGAMMLEAVIFFDLALAEDFAYRRMRGGQLLSKGRYLGAQMVAYLDNDLWLENARRANALAWKLGQGLAAISGIRIPNPVQANEVFAVMPRRLFDGLQAQGVKFYDWMPDSLGGSITADEIFARFVLSFATPEEDVDSFLALAHGMS